jgi:hypothetical protein
MLNVRVDDEVMRRLDAQVALSRREGRRVTKERLVSEAVLAAYPASGVVDSNFLPTHESTLLVDYDPRSNTSLLSALDEIEGEGQLEVVR